ncbi:MAG: helix-turn-helix domain-containing protein [Candidatus Rokuibacteriota bacterium]
MCPVDLARLLGESIRRLRRDSGLTQLELARLLGVSQATLARLESESQNVTLQTLGRVCQALKCEPGDLFRPGQLFLGHSARRRSRAR